MADTYDRVRAYSASQPIRSYERGKLIAQLLRMKIKNHHQINQKM